MLALEIEWLTGVCVAARTPADEAPQWPIEPDRVFSALVATFGAHERPVDERAALEWLERLDAPRIKAASAEARFAATVFVPPNDVASLPDRRRRQPRRFPATIIHAAAGEPHMRILWEGADATAHLDALQTLARDTSYLGHSSALVRCRFVTEAADAPRLDAHATRAAPYPGRLAELEDLYRRHMDKGDANARPAPALLMHAREEPFVVRAPRGVFGRNWIVLEAVGGDRPDLRAAAPIARAMRDALMSVFGDPVPEWLTGHKPDGARTSDPHLAIAPLANVGWSHSDGSLMGLALILPRELEEEWSEDTPAAFEKTRAFERAMARLHVADPENKDAESIRLTLGVAGVWKLQRARASQAKSLNPGRYCGQSRLWSTVTPIALDRFTKSDGAARQEEIADIIAQSCERTSLPPPAEVRVHKHAAIVGSLSAWPTGGAPAWTGWARPKALANRPLFHATIRFEQPVCGPVILGAGRFFGLGLCLPGAERP